MGFHAFHQGKQLCRLVDSMLFLIGLQNQTQYLLSALQPRAGGMNQQSCT